LKPPEHATVRVCHIMSADLWAGAEIQVATVASYLVERPDVELTAVLLNDGPLVRELRRLGVAVTVIDETRYNAVEIVLGLARYLRDHPVDIVHTHRYKDTVLGAIAARVTGVPCVIRTVHGLSEALTGWDWVKLQAYDALDTVVRRYFVDLIIAVSNRVADRLEASGHYPTVVPLHNGVVLRRVQPSRTSDEVRSALGVRHNAPLVGTVGRLSPVKGQGYFLQAARRLLEQQPEARFLLVGDGPLKADLMDTAARLGIDRACIFAGARSDVYDLVGTLDVFVLSSLDEGIPMALLEAMALARPVVATAVGGVPEVIAHRRTGLLVPPEDDKALADACLELLANRPWAQTLGARARHRVQEDFSHEKHGQALERLYRRTVTNSRGRGFWRRPNLRGWAARATRVRAR